MRRILLRIHLWLGLSAGVVLALVSLTGSLLVFHYEIDAVLNPALMHAPAGDNSVGAAQALAAAQREVDSISVLHLPHRQRPVFVAEVPGNDGPDELFIDAATGRIRGRRDPDASFVGIIYDLHNALLLGRNGELTVGFVGVAGLFSLATGMYLWWPRKRKFGQALTLKPRAGPVRRNYDWHRVLGAWSLPLLVVLFSSGIYLAFPNTVTALVERIAPVTAYPPPPGSGQPAGRSDIGAAGALAAARSYWPDATVRSIYPPGPVDAWLITLGRPGDPRKHAGSSGMAIDRYSGEVLQVIDPLNGRIGDIVIHWQYPLHTGEALALPGRILVLLLGLFPPLMLLTGYRIWRAKTARRRG